MVISEIKFQKRHLCYSDTSPTSLLKIEFMPEKKHFEIDWKNIFKFINRIDMVGKLKIL